MGLITLAQYRTELNSALGDRGLDSTRVDRWINFGYLDLAGSVDFSSCDANSSVNTASGVQTIAVPAGTLYIKFLKDTTNDVPLGWLPSSELLRRNVTPTGKPLNWTRDGDLIYLHPVPDATIAISRFYKVDPAILSTDNAVTIFPNTWDLAVLYLAVHHALLGLNEEQRSAVWLARAVTYISSRLTETDLHGHTLGLGASMPNMISNLQSRLAAAQSPLGNQQ